MFLSKITLILSFLACLDSISARVCLSVPFITSIYNISFTYHDSDKPYYTFTFIFESNFDSTKKFTVHNVVLDKNLKIYLDKHDPIIDVIPKDESDSVVYNRFLFNNEEYIIGKSSYDALVEFGFKSRNLESKTYRPSDLMSACESLAISNRPRLSFDLNSTHLQSVQYSGFLRCSYSGTVNETIGTPARITQLRKTIERNIISAFYRYPFLFEFTANGELLLYEFIKIQEPEASKPLGETNIEPKRFKLAGTFLSDSSPDMLFESKYCLDSRVKPLVPMVFNFTVYSEKPPKSFTLLNSKLYVGVSSEPVPMLPFTSILHQKKNTLSSSLTFKAANWQDNLRMEVLSIAQLEGFKPPWCVASVWADEFAKKVGFYFGCLPNEFTLTDIFTGFDTSLVNSSSPVMIVPDDITFWKTCKKIVSFYGSLYTMHNYNENILDTPSKWNKLPLEHFPYPIEAVHAEGDEFWFFVKLTSVLVFTVDSRNCSELVFTRKKMIHYTQLFGNTIAVVPQVVLEGRYWDGSKWNPDWNWLPDDSWIVIKDESTSFRTWLYILIFAAISVIVSLLILSLVLTRHSKEEVYTIKSPRLSRSIRSSPQSPSSQTKPSEMVLFEDQSSAKSIKSKLGKKSPRKGRRRGRRSSSKTPSRSKRSYTLNHKVV